MRRSSWNKPSMTEGLGIAWLALTMVVMSNAAAGGSAALLYAWRITPQHGMRCMIAGAIAGGLLASWLSGAAFIGASEADDLLVIIPTVFGISLLVGTLVSIPGALIVSRKLAAPGDDYRIFE